MPPQELAVLEAGIVDMKQKVDNKLVRTERAASSLHLEAEDLENRRKSEVEKELHNKIRSQTGPVKKEWKPSNALQPEKLQSDVKPTKYTRWKEKWLSWQSEAQGDDSVPCKKMLPYLRTSLDKFWEQRTVGN